MEYSYVDDLNCQVVVSQVFVESVDLQSVFVLDKNTKFTIYI